MTCWTTTTRTIMMNITSTNMISNGMARNPIPMLIGICRLPILMLISQIFIIVIPTN